MDQDIAPAPIITGLSRTPDIKDLFAALAKAQGEMKSIPFDKVNPHFKSKYASLAATIEVIRGPNSKYGISVLQPFYTDERGDYVVETILAHSSGQYISAKITLPVAQKNMQPIGSAVTYAKRYALQAMLCLAGDDDDDGEGAKAEEQKAQAAQAKAKTNEKLAAKPQHPKPVPQTEKSIPVESLIDELTAEVKKGKWANEQVKEALGLLYKASYARDLKPSQIMELTSIVRNFSFPELLQGMEMGHITQDPDGNWVY